MSKWDKHSVGLLIQYAISVHDEEAEWLRRWTADQIYCPRADVLITFYNEKEQQGLKQTS